MKERLIKLIKQEGFILLLFVCVCIVAGGTLFLSMRSLNTTKGNQGNDNFTIVEDDIQDFDLTILPPREIEEDVVEVIIAENGYTEDADDLEFEEDIEDLDLVVIETSTIDLPLDGAIITEYTSDSLIYSETLESWVGHGAIDIGGKEGDVVKAAMDGTVKEVYEDELWGIVIVIDHKDGLQTRYSNLATKEMVKPELQVKKGDHISKIGKTAKIEMLMDPHLHFEVIKNGKVVDPRSIMD